MLEQAIRSGRWILAFVAAFFCQFTHGQDLNGDLLHAIQRATSAVAPDSLKLPDSADLPSPPPEVEAAGKDFVNAWKIWTRIMSTPPGEPKTAPDEKDLINAATDVRFEELLKRAMQADPPPDLSEFDRFTYSDGSFCGSGYLSHEQLNANAITLILIRQGKHFEALKRLARNEDAMVGPLLRAFGVDAEEFRIGGWLNRKLSPEDLCRTGGEKTARMMLDWVEFRMAKVAEKGGNSGSPDPQNLSSEPYPPKQNLIQFLRTDNGVSDETKARYAKFIQTSGLEMIPLRDWVYGCPKGAEKWLVPLAKQGLSDELNRVRKRSSSLLKAAGVEHAEPKLKSNPLFQVRINGKPWPGDLADVQGMDRELGMGLEYEPRSGGAIGRAFRPDQKASDLLTAEADQFIEYGPIKEAYVYLLPSSLGMGPVSPNHPWLRGDVPLPVSFDQINRVDIRTTGFTIHPLLPDRSVVPDDLAYEVKFEMEGVSSVTYDLRSQMPLVLPQVSPGIYWVTVHYPGAVPSPRTKVTISETENLIKPKLQIGSSLVVPVEWPEANSPQNLPDALGQSFSWGGKDCHNSLRSVLILKRKDGSVIKDVEPSPKIVRARFPNSAIFPYLPPGEYLIESPDRTIEPRAGQPGCVIRKSSVSVVISKDSPVYVVSEPIKILYEAKNDGRRKED